MTGNEQVFMAALEGACERIEDQGGITTFERAVLRGDYGASESERLAIAIDALKAIANINERSCEKYVSIADGIAVDALVRLEAE